MSAIKRYNGFIIHSDPICDKDYVLASDHDAAMREMTEALAWAIGEGARYSECLNKLSDHGCGCCSGDLETPKKFESAIKSAIAVLQPAVERGK